MDTPTTIRLNSSVAGAKLWNLLPIFCSGLERKLCWISDLLISSSLCVVVSTGYNSTHLCIVTNRFHFEVISDVCGNSLLGIDDFSLL